MINKIFRSYSRVQRQKLECHQYIWRQIFEALGNSNLSRFPPLKAKWIFYFREIPRKNDEIFYHIFISFYFTRNKWRNILFHFYFIHPEQMTKYFITFSVHFISPRTNDEIFYFIFISSIRNKWQNILSHFHFILFHPERMTKYFISFLFHPSGTNDEIFYFTRNKWRNILFHNYFIVAPLAVVQLIISNVWCRSHGQNHHEILQKRT